MTTNRISFCIGLALSLLFVTLSVKFYRYQYLRQEAQNPQSVTGVLETLDLKILDLKMLLRGPVPSKAPVVLLEVDDAAIEEIGRFPWDRKIISQVLESVLADGAASVGLDIIFSEPQWGDPSSDQALAETFNKYRGQIVGGSFLETAGDQWMPYQDYCVNEAFGRSNGGDVVKLNASFVVEDRVDPYESVNFAELFGPLFDVLERTHAPLIIKNELKLTSESELSDAQRRFLKMELSKKNFQFCRDWLTEKDPLYPNESNPLVQAAFAKILEVPEADLPGAIEKLKTSVMRHPLPASWRWTANFSALQENLDFNASFNAHQDSDGSVRRMPLFYRTGNRMGTSFVPTLALQTYLTATGHRAQVVVDKKSRDVDNKEIVSFDIFDPSQEPEKKVFSLLSDPYSFMRINYYGGTYSVPHVSAREVLRKGPTVRVVQNEQDPITKKWSTQVREIDRKEFFKGRSVIFGATATGVYDLRVTPFEKNFPGPEIHTQALAQLFEHRFLSPWNKESTYMPWIILVLGVLLTLVLTRVGAIPGLLISASTLILIIGADLFLFLKFQIMISVLLPLVLLIVLNFSIQTFKYLTEERKKKELKETFAKYVSPSIVDEVLRSPENLELGGRKQRMSVFFSDVRGFTTLSEKLDPQKLSEILSRYLTPMTEIVFQNKGTLDKYMGDALMAFFGAPVFYQNHAQEACRTALQSLKKLKELQQEFKKEGIPEIDVGIGINTGDMSVGNMGSNIVRSYTVMGDAVNLGSRLEGINKEYGTRIIISEFTYADVKDLFVCREIDRVKVKGKNLPVRIFELIAEGEISSDLRQNVDSFENSYRLYESKDFKKALSQFESLASGSWQDPVSAVFVERCREFIENPPPENWDGVFVMTRK